MRFRSAQAHYCLKWCSINVVILSGLLLDIELACRYFYWSYYFLAA